MKRSIAAITVLAMTIASQAFAQSRPFPRSGDLTISPRVPFKPDASSGQGGFAMDIYDGKTIATSSNSGPHGNIMFGPSPEARIFITLQTKKAVRPHFNCTIDALMPIKVTLRMIGRNLRETKLDYYLNNGSNQAIDLYSTSLTSGAGTIEFNLKSDQQNRVIFYKCDVKFWSS